MRRKDREVTNPEQIERIIAECQVCHVALATPDGIPYVVALNFGYAPGTPAALYFHCATTGRKLDLIRQNPRCAFVLDQTLELVTGPMACDWGMKYESVMGSGAIEIVSDSEQRLEGMNHIMAHYGASSPTYHPELLSKTVVLKLSIEHLTAKRRD